MGIETPEAMLCLPRGPEILVRTERSPRVGIEKENLLEASGPEVVVRAGDPQRGQSGRLPVHTKSLFSLTPGSRKPKKRLGRISVDDLTATVDLNTDRIHLFPACDCRVERIMIGQAASPSEERFYIV